MDLFYASTTISIGNGKIAPFWDSPWLNGRKPKDIAPLIFGVSSRKKWNVEQATRNNAWISKIKLEGNFTLTHLTEFISLWRELNEVTLREDVEDDIAWNLTSNGIYSTTSAYKAQFFGATSTIMNKLVWRVWAPPKMKFFAWLAIHNRLWTADRLDKRGWTNCGLCPLCKQTQETAAHLLSNCCFTKRLWGMVKDWLGIASIVTTEWMDDIALQSWWENMSATNVPNRKAMASLTILVSWTIWNERNARVFRNKSAPPFVLLNIIKTGVKLWVCAGAKCLSYVITGE
jgi:hypothetical protein